jgi:hypothetical protein
MAGAHSSETKRDEIARGGRWWFFLMGPLAIFLTGRLYWIDRYLSENDKEEQKGAMLRELRTAQAGVGSVSYDDRQGGYSATSGGLSGLLKESRKSAVVPGVAAAPESMVAEPATELQEESAGDVAADH